jgi:ATP-binding cassette subfamily F protein 3
MPGYESLMTLPAVKGIPFDQDSLDYMQTCLVDCGTSEDALELLRPFIEEFAEDPSSVIANLQLSINQLFVPDNLHEIAPKVTTAELLLPAKQEISGLQSSLNTEEKSGHYEHVASSPTTTELTAKSKKDLRRQRKQSKAATNQTNSRSSPELKGSQQNAVISSEDSRFQRDQVGDSKELYIRRVDMHYSAGPMLLQGAELRFIPNHRYGLIGKNGCGKTTLLKHLAERNLKAFPDHMSVLYINQQATFTEQSVISFVVESDEQLCNLRAEHQRLMASSTALSANERQRLEQVVSDLSLKLLDGDDGPEKRALQILKTLQFSDTMANGMLSELSGGWRMKAALARALFHPPQLLLLDEPTNHLDIFEIALAETILNQLDSCMIIVSHDHTFLNEVCTDIIQFAKQTLTYFHGDYATYQQHVSDQKTKQQRLYDAQEHKRKHIQGTIDKAIVTARRTDNDKLLKMVAS